MPYKLSLHHNRFESSARHNETLSITAVCVNNPNRSPVTIDG